MGLSGHHIQNSPIAKSTQFCFVDYTPLVIFYRPRGSDITDSCLIMADTD